MFKVFLYNFLLILLYFEVSYNVHVSWHQNVQMISLINWFLKVECESFEKWQTVLYKGEFQKQGAILFLISCVRLDIVQH